MTVKEKMESFYKMPIEKIILEIHWNGENSLESIAKKARVTRQAIKNYCDKSNIKVRSQKEALKISYTKGVNHWSYGMRKETSKIHAAHSERMTLNNPIKNTETQNKRAITIAKTFLEKMYPQELRFRDILNKLNIEYEMQKPIGPYNIDFYIPAENLCIEIDSTNKWGVARRKAATVKDLFLSGLNYKILRINKEKLKDELFTFDVLNRYNIVT
mgnify:CR=1 FL=1